MLTAKPGDLFRVRATMICVVEDMVEEAKSRMDDLETAWFSDLGGDVVSKVDVQALLDAVVKDVIHIIEERAEAAAAAAIATAPEGSVPYVV